MDIKKTNWNDITIADYKAILKIEERNLDSQIEKDIAVLSVLCGIPEKQLYNLQLTELQQLLKKAEWLKNEQFTFNRNFTTKKLKIDGITYNVNPDIDKFTVAQYMDFQNFWNKRNDNKFIGNLLAVFIIPEGCKYNEGYDVMELAERLEQTVSIAFYNSVCFFFLENWLNLIKASAIYSVYLTKKAIRKTKDKKTKKMLKEKEKELMLGLKQILPIG